MKKIISILICLTMILSSFKMITLASDSPLSSVNAPGEAKLLTSLGIMNDSDTEDYWSNKVTRGEFAMYLYNIAKNEAQFETKSYYTDVLVSSELEKAVSHLVYLSVLSVNDQRLFKANDLITFNEAYKMLVTLAGYNTYANALGLYPQGYVMAAQRLKITDNVSSTSENLTNKDAAILIYNTLHIGVFEVESIKDTGFVCTDKDSETVMKRFYDLYLKEGVVTKKNGVDLDSSSRVNKGIIKIDGVEYEDLIEDEKVLGYYVTAYVKENKSNAIDSVVYAEIDSINNVLEIDAKDLIDVNVDKIEYYDKNGKEKTAKVLGAAFVKNGSVLSTDIPLKAHIKKGNLKLVSNQGTNTYDAVIITEYETLVVGLFDSTNKKIYDKFDPSKAVCFDENKYEDIKIYLNGKRANFMHIEEYDVLSLIRSEDNEFVEAHINNDIIEGKIDGVETGLKNIIIVDGKEYDLSDELSKRIAFGTTILGDKATLVLDVLGEVVHVRSAENEKYKVGYVYDYTDLDDKNKGNALAIYTIEGEAKYFKLAKEISINDGKRDLNSKDVIKHLSKEGSDNIIKPQLIRFSLNKDDEVYGINTADYSDNMAKSRYLSKTLEEGSYKYRSNLVYPKTAINDNTIILQVPFDSMIEEGDSYKNYFRKIAKSSFKTTMSYTFEAYDLNDDTPYTDVLIYKRAKAYEDDKTDTIGIIRKVTRVKDGYGNETYALEIFENGVGVKHITSQDCIWKDASNDKGIEAGSLMEGDMVRYNFDGLGSIAYIRYIYRPSENNNTENLSGIVGSYDDAVRLTYHYAVDKYEGNEMDSGGILSLLSLGEGFNDEISFRLPYSRLKKAIVYDSNRKKGEKVYIGTIDNIITYNGTGGIDASVIITHANIGTIKNVYIVN